MCVMTSTYGWSVRLTMCKYSLGARTWRRRRSEEALKLSSALWSPRAAVSNNLKETAAFCGSIDGLLLSLHKNQQTIRSWLKFLPHLRRGNETKLFPVTAWRQRPVKPELSAGGGRAGAEPRLVSHVRAAPSSGQVEETLEERRPSPPSRARD